MAPQTGERHPRFHQLPFYFDIAAAAMKTVALWVSLVGVVCSQDVQPDESGMSLLQHSARPIRKANENLDDPPGPPPPGVAERQAARREARRAQRVAGAQWEDSGVADGEAARNASPAQIERRRARRQAKRQAKRAGHAAATRHFADGGECDTCAAKCTALFNDEFKTCMIREDCQPWTKEDGAPPDKCARRCDRGGNWLREPCIRKCECDVDLIGATSAVTKTSSQKTEADLQKKVQDLEASKSNSQKTEADLLKKVNDLEASKSNSQKTEADLLKKVKDLEGSHTSSGKESEKQLNDLKTKSKNTDNYDWADAHHRCKAVPIGSMSGCTSLAEDANSPAYDSIKKCAKAAVDAGADTFNFYRTSKEYAKCSLRQCGSGDLQVTRAPPSAEPPAGHGNWKVFSTFCLAPPIDQRDDNGEDTTSR